MNTGSLQWEEGFPVMKTGFSLWELLHRENPVLTLYGIAVCWLQIVYEGEIWSLFNVTFCWKVDFHITNMR
jgi:hypothetical protein